MSTLDTDEERLALAHDRLVQACTAREWRSDREDPSDPSTVQAMQIALNLPKQNPPLRNEILAAAGTAVVKVCLDPRAGAPAQSAFVQGLGDWYGHRIRKIARRARNSGWDHVQNLPGATAQHGSAQARAFVPSAVSDVDPLISKLQIGHTDLPADGDLPAPDPHLPVVYIDAGLGMSLGKAAAQVGHGSMMLAAHMSLPEIKVWNQQGYALNVREIDHEEFLKQLECPGAVPIVDAGFTEIAPDSVTVVALPVNRTC